MGPQNVSLGPLSEETHTPEEMFSLSMFSSPDDALQHAIEFLSTVASHQELVYKEVPPDWARPVLDRLDSEFEGRFR